MKASVFIILETFFYSVDTHSFENWGISFGYFPVLAGAY